MNVENKDSNTATGIFSADMTKLIAGDSFTTGLGKANAIMDPDAPRSFEVLSTILANDTLIYFQKPSNFPAHPRPIMAVWNKVAAELIEQGKLAAPFKRGPLPPISREKRCQIMLTPFNDWIKSSAVANKLCRWAYFQFSDKELMSIFWMNNKEEELETAIDCIFQSGAQISVPFNVTFERYPAVIDKVSSNYLREREWRAEEFTVAYIFWAFVKGYLYAESLTSEHIYAVHWLRRRAMDVDVQLRKVGKEDLPDLFPWGLFLSELLQNPKFKFHGDSIAEAILNLRTYTQKDLHHASDEKKLLKFTREGLYQSLPKQLGSHDWYAMLKKSSLVALALWALLRRKEDLSIPVKLAIGINIFDIIVSNEMKARINETGRRLQLLYYRRTISSIIKRHMRELNEYLDARKT
jgi:hypothetical protein